MDLFEGKPDFSLTEHEASEQANVCRRARARVLPAAGWGHTALCYVCVLRASRAPFGHILGARFAASQGHRSRDSAGAGPSRRPCVRTGTRCCLGLQASPCVSSPARALSLAARQVVSAAKAHKGATYVEDSALWVPATRAEDREL